MKRQRRLALVFVFLVLSQTAAAEEPKDPAAIVLPNGQELTEVSFSRHVVPLLSRFGCNGGACHGSFQGRGGMRFSLFGHSPQMDFDALSDRIDLDAPDDSLALLKPTAREDHEGGERFAPDSWAAQILSQWIAQGATPPESTGSVNLRIEPVRLQLTEQTPTVQLSVTVMLADGSEEDVTPFCRFTSGDDGIVKVDEDGLAQRVRAGASHLTVEYLGEFATVITSSPFPREPIDSVPANNFVDTHINRKLEELRLTPSPPAEDDALLRRLTLDAIGRLPTIDEIDSFRHDEGADRIRRTIDRLLISDRHAALWATRFCDMTRSTIDLMEGSEDLKSKQAKMWHDWFRNRLAANESYDKIVRGVLCGTSRDSDVDQWIDTEAEIIRAAREGFEFDYASREFLDLFWRRRKVDGLYPRKELAEITSAAFLGIQIECAGCHKHPYDRWTQADYGSYINVFSQVTYGSSTDLNRAILGRLDERRQQAAQGIKTAALPRLQEIYNSAAMSRPIVDPDTRQPLTPRALGGQEMSGDRDSREQLMEWMIGDGRQQFAANFVNRVWAHYFGRGIVEPVDRFSAISPASHPKLLEALANEFIRSGYNIRHLERTILESSAYQRSSTFAGNNAADLRHYSRSYVRPLLAEVSIDVLNQVLEVEADFGPDLPAGSAAIELNSDRPQNAHVAEMTRTFGRAERKSACDCDRQLEPSLQQTLFLMSNPRLLSSIEKGGLIADLMAASSADEGIEIMFLRTLSRRPTDQERKAARDHWQRTTSEKKSAWVDLIWAMINTREFLTNH